jgi:uncharacterized membrane protein YfcA
MRVLQRGNRLSITPVTASRMARRAGAAESPLNPGLNKTDELWPLWPNCWPWAAPHRLPGRPAGHRRRHVDGALHDPDPVPARGEPGLAVKMAIATSMATILFTSMSSVRAHHARGAVRWDLVRGTGTRHRDGRPAVGRRRLLPCSRADAGRRLCRCSSASRHCRCCATASPRRTRQMPGAVRPGVAAGGVIGLVSGLVGAGGGFISVPFMVWCNVPSANAVATSAALGFPIALAGHAGLCDRRLVAASGLPGAVGYLYLPALALIAAASVLLAPLGARVAHRHRHGQAQAGVRAAAVRPGRLHGTSRRLNGARLFSRPSGMLASVTWLPPRRWASANAASQASAVRPVAARCAGSWPRPSTLNAQLTAIEQHDLRRALAAQASMRECAVASPTPDSSTANRLPS